MGKDCYVFWPLFACAAVRLRGSRLGPNWTVPSLQRQLLLAGEEDDLDDTLTQFASGLSYFCYKFYRRSPVVSTCVGVS